MRKRLGQSVKFDQAGGKQMRLSLSHGLALFAIPGMLAATVLTVLAHPPQLYYTASLVASSGRRDLQSLPQYWEATVTPVPSRVQQPTPQKKISASLLRLDQSSLTQYANKREHDQWWGSACSAAAMTEIINAYQGTKYRITDVLSVEASFSSPQVISQEAGLLYPEGISRVIAYFGFVSTKLVHPTLGQIIRLANTGTPVLVNFPPSRWTGGHFVVVKGGTNKQVEVVDSSKLNLRTLTHQQFLEYWEGFAQTFTPTRYSVLGPPTLSASFIEAVLSAYHSPTVGKGQVLYDLGVKYHVDPAVALAFFLHESAFGTQGIARESRSLGNLRCIKSVKCQKNFAHFDTWEQGFEAFYALLSGPWYAASGLVIPEQIIPRYAPASDNNDVGTYIAALKYALDSWRQGRIIVH